MSNEHATAFDDPKLPLVSVHDYAERAARLLPTAIRGYYNSGAGAENTLRDNCNAFNRLHIRPRCLRDVSARTTASTLLGHQLSMPVGIAPTAMQRMANPDGEVATARAAHSSGTIYIMSTLSTSSIEEVAAAAPPDTLKWFQLYIYRNRELTERLVRRAEAAGFAAIVLTVDAPVFGVRRADVRNRFALPAPLELRNFSGSKAAVRSDGSDSGIQAYVSGQFDPRLTWDDLRWLVAFARVPVIVKGVLTGEDARLAVECGVAGVIVSNHGARQVDTVQASVSCVILWSVFVLNYFIG